MSMTGLCVGGPLDGKVTNVGAHRTFQVPVPLTMEDMKLTTADAVNVVKYREVSYVLEHLWTGDRDFFFWRPRDQSLSATMQKLIDGYRPEARR